MDSLDLQVLTQAREWHAVGSRTMPDDPLPELQLDAHSAVVAPASGPKLEIVAAPHGLALVLAPAPVRHTAVRA